MGKSARRELLTVSAIWQNRITGDLSSGDLNPIDRGMKAHFIQMLWFNVTF